MLECPDVCYSGIDISVAQNPLVVCGDFLKSPLTMVEGCAVVAQEVIEHLDSRSIIPELILRLLTHGANYFFFTTPNASFTAMMGVERRHKDHKFELDEKDLIELALFLKPHGIDMRFEPLGMSASDIPPTWGVTCIL